MPDRSWLKRQPKLRLRSSGGNHVCCSVWLNWAPNLKFIENSWNFQWKLWWLYGKYEVFNGLVERKPRFLPPLFRVFPLKPETNSVIIILDRSYWQGTIGTIFGNFSCKGMNTWWNHFGVDQFFNFKEETQCFLLIFLRVVEKTLPLVDIKGTGVFDGIMDKSTDCLKSNPGTTGDIMGVKGGISQG